MDLSNIPEKTIQTNPSLPTLEEKPFCCSELNNIKYKNFMQTGVQYKETKYSMNIDNVNEYLNKEGQIKENQAWWKLHKSTKLKKLLEFAEIYEKQHRLNEEEGQIFRDFLKQKLNENKLTKVKEVEYDKELAIIKNIPNISFSKQFKLFSLSNNSDKQHFASFSGPLFLFSISDKT